MFWLVQRSDKLSECNLTLEYPEVDVTVSVKIENGKLKRKWAHVWDAGELPRCPILTNNAKISANTRLVTREDVDLKVLSEKKTAADALREKEKKYKDEQKAGE